MKAMSNNWYRIIFSKAITDIILSAYTEEAPEMLWKIVLCSDLTGYKMGIILFLSHLLMVGILKALY